MTRYRGYYIDKRLHNENMCRMGIDYTYSHQGNDVAMDYPGHEIYDEREEKITFLSVVATPTEEPFKEELKKFQERVSKISLKIAILMGASSKWSPRPKIDPTISYSKPY